jgi:uncharacterized protein YlxW (UPF0749 family)
MGPMSTPAPPRSDEQPHRADSMLLLRDLVEGSLDEGYARAAARRGSGEPPGRGSVWVLTVGLLAVGLLLATAFAQTRARATSAAEARDALVAEVQQRADDNAAAQRRLDRQRASVQRAQQRELTVTAEGADLARRLGDLEAATGAGAVSGPGMVIRVDDATATGDAGDGADVDPRTDTGEDGRVTDRDLQTVVNEVWAAGAEAVAVNGQRLTALSAIRAAGDAVLVDFRPLTPPYVIEAIGDPDQLRPRFVGGFGGSYLQVLEGYGITSTVRDDDQLKMPASVGVALRYAAPSAGPGTAGAEKSTPGDSSTTRSGDQ